MQWDTETALTGTRTERLADQIRTDIVRDVYRAGVRLTEEFLADRYGLSRTPVREALRTLAREHLLDYVPRSGYFVATVNLEEMDDLYTVRVAVEEQVALRIVRAEVIDPLLDLQEFWSAPPEIPMSDVNLVFADENFHETLAEASESTVLAPMLRNINQRVHCLRVRDFIDPERVRLTFEQHAAILTALLQADDRHARALLRAHIWQSYAFVRASFSRSQEDRP